MTSVNPAEWPDSKINYTLPPHSHESIGDEIEAVEITRLEVKVNAITENYLETHGIAFNMLIEATPLPEAGQLRIKYASEEERGIITVTITNAKDLEQINAYKAACDAWKRAHPFKHVPMLPYA